MELSSSELGFIIIRILDFLNYKLEKYGELNMYDEDVFSLVVHFLDNSENLKRSV